MPLVRVQEGIRTVGRGKTERRKVGRPRKVSDERRVSPRIVKRSRPRKACNKQDGSDIGTSDKDNEMPPTKLRKVSSLLDYPLHWTSYQEGQ